MVITNTPNAQQKDVSVGDDGRDQKMAAVFSGPMGENDGHGVFEHGEGHGTKEQHKQDSDDAY